jgi:DNA polymerase-3 subunit alpha
MRHGSSLPRANCLADPGRTRRFSQQMWLRSQAEMVELFADLPAALANTVEIARRCHLTMRPRQSALARLYGARGAGRLMAWLRWLGRNAGLQERFKVLSSVPAVCRRLTLNIGARTMRPGSTPSATRVVRMMGFSGYFLIVADFVNWAKQNDVPVGTSARGSGAGSLRRLCVVGCHGHRSDPYVLVTGTGFGQSRNESRCPILIFDFCQDRRAGG